MRIMHGSNALIGVMIKSKYALEITSRMKIALPKRSFPMNHRYANILKPIKIGNVFIKNRLLATRSVSQELQGPENFPAESTIAYLEEYAKNGAAVVVCPIGNWPDDRTGVGFESMFQMEDMRTLNYFGQMTRRIHRHGTLAIGSLNCSIPQTFSISERRHPELVLKPLGGPGGDFLPDGRPAPPKPEMSKDEIRSFTKRYAEKCKIIKACGFDGVNVYMSYNASILAHSLSPVLNQRIDEYGGSAENRARLMMELFKEIKTACGNDFLVECQISGEEDMPNGYTTEDFLEYAKMCEGLVDIFQIHAKSGMLSHASSYSYKEHEPTTLRYAEMFKKRGIKACCAPVGGYQSLDDIERFIAEGKTDMVAMARAFICDGEYGRKLIDERDDVVPCIRCDKCHGGVCSVNPQIGFAHAPAGWPQKSKRSKKVAVLGGGPAGMLTAVVAARRGHEIVLYEASARLGGQLVHSDYMPGKWALANYKNYLISQVEKGGVSVLLNTPATPDVIDRGGFDAVIAAPGSVSKRLSIPGGGDKRILVPMQCFGHTEEIGDSVIVIGGGGTGSETALYLSDSGKKVILVTRQPRVLHDDVSHGGQFLFELFMHHPNLQIITDTRTLSFADGTTVTLAGRDGKPYELSADTIVVSAGVIPNTDALTGFLGLTPEFFVVGDANIHEDILWQGPMFQERTGIPVGGDVRHATTTAYAAAMQL